MPRGIRRNWKPLTLAQVVAKLQKNARKFWGDAVLVRMLDSGEFVYAKKLHVDDDYNVSLAGFVGNRIEILERVA